MKAKLLLLLAGLSGTIGVLPPTAAAQSVPDPVSEELPSPRVPVLIVPGWWGREEDLRPFRDRLLRDGWEPWEVAALEFEDPVGSNRSHAREVEAALHTLLEASSASHADIVAHSMGGLAVWYLLQQEKGRLPIRRVVFLGSPLQGTLTAYLAWGEGGTEMRPGSDFLDRLLSGGRPQEWVEAITIRTPLDINVVPVSGATLPGLGDRMICCPTHQGLLDHEPTYEAARAFLTGGASRGARGKPVLEDQPARGGSGVAPSSTGRGGEVDPLGQLQVLPGNSAPGGG